MGEFIRYYKNVMNNKYAICIEIRWTRQTTYILNTHFKSYKDNKSGKLWPQNTIKQNKKENHYIKIFIYIYIYISEASAEANVCIRIFHYWILYNIYIPPPKNVAYSSKDMEINWYCCKIYIYWCFEYIYKWNKLRCWVVWLLMKS